MRLPGGTGMPGATIQGMAMSTLFIAGTDTGVGKTHATCTLLHLLRSRGNQACGMKPVASGCVETPQGLRNDDALAPLRHDPTDTPEPERLSHRDQLLFG